jgi:dTDP-glucose pyrophosphorylase
MKYKVISDDVLVITALDYLEFSIILFVINSKGILVGALTNGDVRRAISKNIEMKASISTIMNSNVVFAFEYESNSLKYEKIRSLPKSYEFLPIVGEDMTFLKIVTPLDLLKKDNRVILMAGGLGSRLGELTKNIPKPMLHIGDKPILEIIIREFKKYYFNDFLISENYKSDVIKNYFKNGDNLDINIEYIDETKKMGTAGCLSVIKDKICKPFFVMNGDILTEENFEEMMNYHNNNQFEATMCVFEHKISVPYGVVESNEYNQITSLVEKPIKKFNVNAGIYILNPSILDLIPEDSFFDMPQLFEKLIKRNRKTGIYKLKTSWIDIGHPEDYFRANDMSIK